MPSVYRPTITSLSNKNGPCVDEVTGVSTSPRYDRIDKHVGRLDDDPLTIGAASQFDVDDPDPGPLDDRVLGSVTRTGNACEDRNNPGFTFNRCECAFIPSLIPVSPLRSSFSVAVKFECATMMIHIAIANAIGNLSY